MADANTLSLQVGLSDAAREEIAQIVAAAVDRAMAQLGSKRGSVAPAALKAADAARFLGVGRSTFYNLLKADAALMAASFKIGTSRVWAIEVLDDWLRAGRGLQICTKMRAEKGAAGLRPADLMCLAKEPSGND
jgi:predicted DNA-binding transcriptional regulator AlpA